MIIIIATTMIIIITIIIITRMATLIYDFKNYDYNCYCHYVYDYYY